MIEFDREKARWKGAEDILTPLEVRDLIRSSPETKGIFSVEFLLRTQPPRRFLRESVAEGAHLFSARNTARHLIIAFTGRAGRLMAPLPNFLQMIDDTNQDVLVLMDRRKLHYDRGADGFGTSLVEMISRIRDLVSNRAYRSVVTYGTSMGGFVALRAGIALGAVRAVSVGGRFCWHIPRWRTGSEEISAFDPLCACRVSKSVSLVVVYAAQNQEDVQSAQMIERILPQSTLVPIETETHNVVAILNQKRMLETFYQGCFDPSGHDVCPQALW